MSLPRFYKRLKERRRRPSDLGHSQQHAKAFGGEEVRANIERRSISSGRVLASGPQELESYFCAQLPTSAALAHGQLASERKTPVTTVNEPHEQFRVNETLTERTPIEGPSPRFSASQIKTTAAGSTVNSTPCISGAGRPARASTLPNVDGHDQRNLVKANIGGVFDTKSCVNLKLTLDVHVQCEKKDLCLFTGNGGVSFSAPDFCEPLGMLLPGTMVA
ncbi:hypothetical protein SCHPADRAFT_899874 [Schizopora paradoxa]|uniref:Uncharacterized protein n=1 Tax=Schizopora paradoxa TaxID=27342 RepID=A0A0H2S981_9AGAM|nr:hypothetical protein SCHPADRAFT_899874 [Schizopora paradoxa]